VTRFARKCARYVRFAVNEAASDDPIHFVYVIGIEGGPTKVGRSCSIPRRLYEIEREECAAVFLAGAWPWGPTLALAVERYSHWMLRQHQYRGEWFNVSCDEAIAIVSKAMSTDLCVLQTLPPIDAVGPKSKFPELFQTRYPAGTIGRIKTLLGDDPDPSSFIRGAVDREIRRRALLPTSAPPEVRP